MLEATIQELRKACLKNAKGAAALQGTHTSCQSMLAFYSAECGLKSVIMAGRGEKTSKAVAQYGHNIRSLLAEARISARELGLQEGSEITLPTIRRDTGGDEVSFSELHTAWRYGVALETAGETAAAAIFNNLTSALRKRLTT